MSCRVLNILYCSDCDSIHSSFFRVWTDEEEEKQYTYTA